MLAATQNYIAKNTDKQIRIVIEEEDPRVKELFN